MQFRTAVAIYTTLHCTVPYVQCSVHNFFCFYDCCDDDGVRGVVWNSFQSARPPLMYTTTVPKPRARLYSNNFVKRLTVLLMCVLSLSFSLSFNTRTNERTNEREKPESVWFLFSFVFLLSTFRGCFIVMEMAFCSIRKSSRSTTHANWS